MEPKGEVTAEGLSLVTLLQWGEGTQTQELDLPGKRHSELD